MKEEDLLEYAIDILKKDLSMRTDSDIMVLKYCTKKIKFFNEVISKYGSYPHE